MNQDYLSYMRSNKKEKKTSVRSEYSSYVNQNKKDIENKKKTNRSYLERQQTSSTAQNSNKNATTKQNTTSQVPSGIPKTPPSLTPKTTEAPKVMPKVLSAEGRAEWEEKNKPTTYKPVSRDTVSNVNKTKQQIDDNKVNGVSVSKNYSDDELVDIRWKAAENEYKSLDDDTLDLLDTMVDVQDYNDRATRSVISQIANRGSVNAGAEVLESTKAKDRAKTAKEALKQQGYSDEDIEALTEYRRQQRNAKKSAEMSEVIKKETEEHPVAGSVFSVVSNVASPMGYIETARAKAKNVPIDPNSIYFAPTQTTSGIREEVQSNYDWNIDLNKDGKSWDAFDFVYGAGMSTADSLVAGAMMPSLGLTTKSANWAVKALTRTANSMLGGSLIGAQAMTSTIQDVTRRGGTTEEAINAGVVSFFAETLSEAWSIGNFKGLQESGKRGLLNLAKDLIKSSGVNASEEAITEAVNIVYDRYALGDKSNFELNVQAYMQTPKADGSYYTREEAEQLAWKDSLKQIGEAAASGAFQGVLMGGTANVSGRVSNYAKDSKVGKGLRQEGMTDAVVEAARTSEDKTVQEYVQKINKKGKENASNADVGSVARELMKGGKTTESALETIGSYTRPKTLTSAEIVQITHPTLSKADGKVVSLSSVESVKDGKITVKNSEGATQTLDVNKLDGKAKELWSYASEHFNDAQAVETFIRSYDGQNIDIYSRNYKAVFDLASVGMTAQQIVKEDIFEYRTLGKSAFDSAVESGHQTMTYKQGVVDLTTQRKSNSQKLVMRMADEFGKRHGMNITFVDTLGSREGFFTPNKNQIVIALDSSKGAISRTLGHETYHYVESESPQQAKEISDFVIDSLTRIKGEKWVNDRYSFYEKNGYKTLDEQKSELVADQMFEVFANERAVNEFVAKDRTFAQKVLDHIKGLIAEIKNIYKKLVASGNYEDIAAWQEDLDALQKVNDMMLDALSNIEQRKNTGQKAEKNTSDEVVNSVSRNPAQTKYENDVDAVINGTYKSRSALIMGVTPKIYHKLGFSKLPIAITKNHVYSVAVTEQQAKADGRYNKNTNYHGLGVQAVKDIYQNISDPIMVILSADFNVTSPKNKRESTHKVIAIVDLQVDGRQVIAPIEIDAEVTNGKQLIDVNLVSSYFDKSSLNKMLSEAVAHEVSGDVGFFYVDKKRAENVFKLARVQYPRKLDSLNSNGIIHTIDEKVNRKIDSVLKSQQFVRWFGDWQNHPESASKIVNADGTPKVMYHGTQNDFTVFDKKKAKSSGYYGKGFYFTDSESHSSHYGKSMAVYLNVKNPLEQGKNHISKKQLRNFLEAVAENEDDYDIWNYGTENIDEIIGNIYKDDAFAVIQDVNATAIGDLAEAIELFNAVNKTNYDGVITPTEVVVYKPTQIKSATDNIGTFDKENPDIRFSTKRPVEETKDLIAVHNMQESELLKTLQLGGFPMPSIAIIKAQQGHSEYGPVSVVFNKSTIDPKKNKNNKVYGGDAWTPTYPTIEYKVNDKVQEKISNLYYELYRKYGADEARPLYNYVYDMERQLNTNRGEAGMIENLKDDERLMQLYLLQSGKGKVEPVIKQTVTELSEADAEMYDYLISAIGKDIVSELKTSPGKNPLQYRTEFYEKNGEKIENAYKQMLRDNFDFTEEQIDNVMDNMTKRDFINLIRRTYQYMVNGKTTIKEETDGKATSEAIRNAIKDSGFNQWVDDLFKGVEEKSGIRNNADYFTSSGNRRSWEALHWENTLENVVKVMKSQNNGVAAFFSGHAIWGVSAKDYKSIEEIKADSDRLKAIPQEEYDAIKEGFGMRLNEIATSIMDKSESNQFIAADNAMQCIVEAVRNSKTKSGILNELKQYRQLDVTETAVDDIVSLVSDISNMPTEYFEAKPQRAVGLDEIAYVVVPETSTELVDVLNERGIETRTYISGDEADRVKALNSDESVLFSTKREPSISEEASNYILDTKEYQQIIDIVNQRYNLTNKKTLSSKAIDRLAGKLLANSKSKYDKGALTERLSALFDYMANSNELVWEDVMKTSAEIAHDILSQSSSLDRSMQNQYKDTLDYLKGMTIYISPEVRAEIDSRYGSLENYRRMLGGKTKITVTDSSKVSLDSLWRELNEYHPEMFDADTNSLDQAEELMNFFDMTKPTYVNQYEYYWDMNEASYDFALQIYEEYFNIPEVQTESQKHKLEMERLKGKQNAQIAQIRKEYKDRIKRLRSEKNSKIEATKELYRERNRQYREKRNDTAERQRLRRQIVRETKRLTNMLVNPTDQKHIPQELIVGINSFAKAMTEHGVFPAQRAAKLQQAFKNIGEKATDPDFNIASMYDEEIDAMLDNLTSVLSNKRLGEMTSAELAQVRDIARYFSHVVSMSNQAFSDGIKEKLSELQTSTFNEVASQSKDKKRMMYKMQTGLLKPVTFFEILESPTLEKLYTNIRKGEEKWARIVSEAKQKRVDAQNKHNYKEWADDRIDITTERDDKLSISVKEALSIYATSKRAQGVDHIMKGGIVLEEEARKQLEKKNRFKKNRDKSVNVRSANIPLSLADIQNINSSLTEEQKAYADELVRYMSSDMAKLGNEVSMALYGIQKYNEGYYFPLKSASNFLYSEPGVENDSRIKHMSMTKRTVPKANNPVVIGDFTETAMSHCNDMALYYGFTLPLEDFKRVWNYKTPTIEGATPSSIKQQIDMVYGDKANKYIKQMLTDINGGVTKQAGADVVNKMISLIKKNSVFASLSVAVQQPSAIARALAYVDSKYFVGVQKKGTWEEVKKYAPVAVIKEMGYFDTGIGRQAVDWMTETEYEGLIKKAIALFIDRNYRDDVLSFLPSYMDEISWGRIWVAVKNETKAKHPELDVKSEEFLNKVGERFTYVIDRTQVYDSVFSRSEWMRSKDTGVKVATAFMSEPLTNYNMLYNAAIKAKNGNKKFAARALSAYVVSIVFNSILKSFVTSARDDDEEKSFWEKYIANVISNITDEPFGMIPYFNDVISLIQGYGSDRMDTQILADSVDALSTIFNSEKSIKEKVKAFVNTLGLAIGVPFKNLNRDAVALYNGAQRILKGDYEPTTGKGIKYAVAEKYDSSKFKIYKSPNLGKQVVEAYLEGDTAHYNKQYNNMLEKYGGDESKVASQIRTALKEQYTDGKISYDEAKSVLINLCGESSSDAYWKLDEWDTPLEEGETYSKYDDFYDAVSQGNVSSVARIYKQQGVSKETLSGRITSEFKEEYVMLYKTNPAKAKTLKQKLLNAYVAIGYDREEKSKDIDRWLKQK